MQGTVGGVVVKSGNGVMHFVNHISEPAGGMKCEVPGTRSGVSLREGRVRRKGSPGTVESIDKGFIEAEVVHNGKAVVGRQVDRVGVWSFLALRICAVAAVLHECRRLTQTAIIEHRKYRDAAARVVCHQNVLSSFV